MSEWYVRVNGEAFDMTSSLDTDRAHKAMQEAGLWKVPAFRGFPYDEQFPDWPTPDAYQYEEDYEMPSHQPTLQNDLEDRVRDLKETIEALHRTIAMREQEIVLKNTTIYDLEKELERGSYTNERYHPYPDDIKEED